MTTRETTQPVTIDYLDNLGPAAHVRITIPAGTRARLVPDLSGTTGAGWVVDDVALLIRLTGNDHDPHYRYAVLPAEAFEPMGLLVDIYRPASGGDCSNNGISARYTSALVVGDNIPPIFSARGRPIVRLEPNRRTGTARLVPLEVADRWTMFGGCFCYTSDSRFSDAVRAIYGATFYGAVPLHDRVEG